MKDILGVCLCNTYKEETTEKEIDDEKLKEITRRAWKINNKNINNIKFIVGFFNKQIVSIYKVKENNSHKEIITEKNGKREKRYSFNVYNKIDKETKNRIRKAFNNKVIFHGAIRYLNSEDL